MAISKKVTMTDEHVQYRAHLYQLEQKAQESFDKSVLSLSGGALGVSFAFTESFIGTPPYRLHILLALAWIAWAGSIVAILASFFTSTCALRKELARGWPPGDGKGNRCDMITAVLNVTGGLLFPTGVVLLAVFVLKNLGGSK